MGKYLKLFETHAEYESFIQTDYDKPNVSYCEDNNEVHYNPIEPPLPNNVIRYEASEKLTETTSDKSSGLHPNKFGTTMVSHTFENGVGTIEFEDDITIIDAYAFFGCSSLTSIDIPNTVTSIDGKGYVASGAFEGCSSLTSVTIPNSVTSIGGFAFNKCTSLTSVTISNSVTSIGGSAFGNCSSLTSIVIDSGNIVYDSRDNCNAIIETATNRLIFGCKNTVIPDSVTSIGSAAFDGCSSLTSITIPDSVTSIGNNAFYNCRDLTNVTIGSGVTSIGQGVFYNCSSLTSVTIPNSVTSIGSDAFYDCSGLTSVTIPNSVTSIGEHSFAGCSGLTSVTIPNSVTNIGSNAFNACSGLQSITSLATTPPYLGYDAFYDITNNCPIYVPSESVEAYKTANNWSTYASRIQAIPTA